MNKIWSHEFNQVELGEIARVATGCTYPLSDYAREDWRAVVTINKIIGPDLDLLDLRYIRISEREYVRHMFKPADIIFNHKTSAGKLGSSALFNLQQPVLHTKYLRIQPGSDIDSRFLLFVLKRYKSMGKFLECASFRQNLASVALTDLKKIKVPYLPLDMQLEYLQEQTLLSV